MRFKYAMNVRNSNGRVFEAIPLFGFTSGKGNVDGSWLSNNVKMKEQLNQGMEMIFGSRYFSLVIPREKAKVSFQPGTSIDSIRINITDSSSSTYIKSTDGKLVFFGKFTLEIKDLAIISCEDVPQNKYLSKLITMELYNHLALQAPQNDRAKWLNPALIYCRLGDHADFRLEENN